MGFHFGGSNILPYQLGYDQTTNLHIFMITTS